MNSRSLVKLQWFIIGVLIIAYIFKPCPPCDEIAGTTRTVYVTMHDSTPKVDTIQPKKTGVRRKHKDLFIPSDPIAVVVRGDSLRYPLTTDTLYHVIDSCDEYLATTSDSMVDIQVKWCSPCDVGSVEITQKLKGIKSIHTIDSIPYDVGIKTALYLGASVTTGQGFGPKIDLVNKKRSISYTFDAVQNQHIIGATFRIWAKQY